MTGSRFKKTFGLVRKGFGWVLKKLILAWKQGVSINKRYGLTWKRLVSANKKFGVTKTRVGAIRRGFGGIGLIEKFLIVLVASALIFPFVSSGMSSRTMFELFCAVLVVGMLLFLLFLQSFRKGRMATSAAGEVTPATVRPVAPTVANNSTSSSASVWNWLPPLLLIAALGFAIWYSYEHWNEWFPKTVQCSESNETHQDCTMGPGEEAVLPVPTADPTQILHICMILGSGRPGEFEGVWYKDNLSNSKQPYYSSNPPKNVTSYRFKAGPEGATVTHWLAQSC